MLYLGVDLGGTNIKAALVNSEGEILCEAGRRKGRCRCWCRMSGNCGRRNRAVFQQSGLA